MDATRVLRHIDQMNIRIRKLEEAIGSMAPTHPDIDPSDLFETREHTDLGDAKVEAEFISGNPMLSAMYTSENKKMNKFTLGTWPDNESSNSAVVIHGAQRNLDGEPIEFLRMRAYPALIEAGVPFSSVYTDPDEEQLGLLQKKMIDDAASHVVSLHTKPPIHLSMYQDVHVVKNHGCGPGGGGWSKIMVLVTQKKSFRFWTLTAKNSDSLAVIENMASSGSLRRRRGLPLPGVMGM